jgi:hypothetical protein
MKRITVLLTVVALMVGMLAMSVAPAFAKGGGGHFVTIHEGPNAGSVVGGEGVGGVGGHGCGPLGCHGSL